MTKAELLKLKVEEKLSKVKAKTQPKVTPLLSVDDIEVTGNTEVDDKAEFEVIRKALDQQYRNVAWTGDKGYIIPLVFLSQAMADEFLEKLGIQDLHDSTGAYWDGYGVAKKLGVELKPTPPRLKAHKPSKVGPGGIPIEGGE